MGGLAVGLVRTKLIASLIGPSGVGLMGTLNALMAMGASIAAMGIDSSAVRQLSAAADDAERSRIARWAVWSYAWPLALLGTLICWLLRIPLAKLALGSATYAGAIGWIALGVGASVIGSAQMAQVQAWRRMGDLARIRVSSAFLAATAGVGAIYLLGVRGIVVPVLALPIATCLTALWFSRSLPKWKRGRFPGRALFGDWQVLASLGAAVMFAAAMGSVGQAAVRSIITQKLGLGAAGLFQASFAISSLNMGLVLGAMVPEYYPRLSAAAEDSRVVEELFNQQLHVGLILAGPALIGISAFAPIVLHILYTDEFTGAALLLRLQVVADALRVLSWAVGFVLLARKRTLGYLLVEATFGVLFVPLTWFAAPRFGIAAAGATYLIGIVGSLCVAMTLARADGVRVHAANAVLLCLLVATLLLIVGISVINPSAAMVTGGALLIISGLQSLRAIKGIGMPTPFRRRSKILPEQRKSEED
jgi:O-antigen/teichoic acid export membrane protein